MPGRYITLQKETTVAANATTDNVLQGTRFAPAQSPGLLTIYAIAQTGDMDMNVLVGGDDIAKAFRLGTAARMPETDKDGVIFSCPVNVNEQIELTFSDASGAANQANWRAVFLPRGRRR